jgi:hypothetical protein
VIKRSRNTKTGSIRLRFLLEQGFSIGIHKDTTALFFNKIVSRQKSNLSVEVMVDYKNSIVFKVSRSWFWCHFENLWLIDDTEIAQNSGSQDLSRQSNRVKYVDKNISLSNKRHIFYWQGAQLDV